MAASPLLQVRVIVRERDASGMSGAWIAIMLVGYTLWLSYGVVHDNTPLLLANLVALTVTVVLSVATWIHRSGSPEGTTSPATEKRASFTTSG